MKRITALLICLITSIPVLVQGQEIEDVERVVDYTTDSLGKMVRIEDPEYYRVRAKDGSSWGYQNRNGDYVIPVGRYKFLNPIDEHGMILAQKDGKEGFIDIHENILIPFEYDDVGVFSKCVDLAPVIKGGKQGFVNRRGDIVIPLEYDALSYVTYFYEPGKAILIKDGRYGVIDSQNNIIVPFEYDKIEWSDNKDSFIATTGKDWTSFAFNGKQLSGYNDYEIVTGTHLGYLPSNSKGLPILVRTKGNQKLRTELFSDIEYMNGSKRIRDSLETLTGVEFAYIDKAQNMIVPFGTYDNAEPFGLGRKAIVASKGKYGIIDEYGKPVLPLEYDFVERPSQYSNYADIFVATKGNKVTILDSDVNVIPTDGIVSYDGRGSDLIVSNAKGKMGRVNHEGKLSIPIIYDTLFRARHTGFIAAQNGLYGYISSSNKIIEPFEYLDIYSLKDNLVFVNAGGKAGLLNKRGDVILPFEYEAIYDTWYNNQDRHKTCYIVVKNGKVGTVDINNNVVIPIIYDGLSGWVEYGPEAHFVKDNGRYGLISHEGQVIIPIEYDYVGLPQDGVIEVRKNGKYGVISMKNSEIIPCIYDFIILDIPYFDFNNTLSPKLVVLQNNVWSYLDMHGNLVRENIPIDEIRKEYGYRLDWGEPLNEGYDFNIIQAVKD